MLTHNAARWFGRRFPVILAALLCVIFWYACDMKMPADQAEGTATIQLKVLWPSGKVQRASYEKLVVDVRNTSLLKEFPVVGNQVEWQIENVPVGLRTVELEVWGYAGGTGQSKILYQGLKEIMVSSGNETPSVEIQVLPITVDVSAENWQSSADTLVLGDTLWMEVNDPYTSHTRPEIQFDWGDGNATPWLLETTASNVYSRAGIYTVRGNLRDSIDVDSDVHLFEHQVVVRILSPETSIIDGPVNGEISTEEETRFAWEGNHRFVNQFRYRLDEGIWSNWAEEKSIALQMDEGDHRFEVMGRIPPGELHPEREESVPEIRNFSIDAISGPALWIKPRADLVLSRGDTSVVGIMVEDVEPIVLAHLVLEFDSDVVQVEKTWRGAFWGEDGEVVVLERPLLGGGHEIDLAVGETSPVEGSGAIAHIRLHAIGEGTTSLQLAPSTVRLRDVEGKDQALRELQGIHIIIE